MFSTQTQFTQNKEQNGRKKFGTSAKIASELRRAVRNSNTWTHNTPKDLLQLFEYDVNRKFLPVRGNRVIKFAFNNFDVLSLLRTFKIEKKEAVCGRKLFQSPIYSGSDICRLASQELGFKDEYPYFSEISNQDTALQCFSNIKVKYNAMQHYDVDGEFHYSSIDTFICCLYEFLKLYEVTGKDLEQKFYEQLIQLKYKRLDAYGIYIFLLHLKIRGIAKITNFKNALTWRNLWSLLSKKEKDEMMSSFYAGKNTDSFLRMMDSSIREIEMRLSLLTHEAKLVRYPAKIGRNAFNPRYIYYLTYIEGIYKQLSVQEKYRDMNGLKVTGEFTMFSPTKIAENLASNTIDAVKPQMQQAISEMLQSEAVRESFKNLATEALKPTLDAFEGKTEKVTVGMIDSIKSTVQPVIDQAFSLFSSINGIIGFIKTLLQQAIDAFPKNLFGDNSPITITPSSMLYLIRYYLVYINVESKPFKLILIYLMLSELGLLDYIMKWGSEIFQLVFGSKNSQPVEEDEIVGEPTSNVDWLMSLATMITGKANEISLCTFFTTLVVMIYKNMKVEAKLWPLRRSEFSSIAGIVVGICKNMHWIGSGLFGIDRIYKYFMVVSNAVTEYVKKNIMGVRDEIMSNEIAVAHWLASLQHFSTDAGRHSIRVSEKNLERAEKIMPTGLAFIAAAAKDPKFLSKESVMNIHRKWSDVKTLANYTYRIRSTSSFKPAMFHIQFVGEPGIGKSTLTEKFIKALSHKIYPSDKRVTHWTYNPNIDHFDGYNGQTCMIIDDLFRYNEPKHLSLIIGLITNTPVPLPMAHLEDKGVHLDSDLLISSTNVPYPIGKDIFCMEAVHRRRHILTEVKMDGRVKKNGQFSMELFHKYYPGQNSYDFPHLRFSLMKPVVMPGENPYQKVDRTQVEWKYNLIKKLQKANDALQFEPEFYFGEDARPLEGMTVPCTDWNFATFIENTAVAYKHMRAGENKLSAREKYDHVMDCFAEIDNLFMQSNDFESGVYASTSFKLLEDKFLDMSLQYGIEDPLGERIYKDNASLAPEIDDFNPDDIIKEFLQGEKLGQPTNGSDCSDDVDFWSTYGAEEVNYSDHVKETRLNKIGFYMRTHDVVDPMRKHILYLMHKLAMEEPLSRADEQLLAHIVDNTPNPYFEEERMLYSDYSDNPETSRRQRILNKMNKRIIDPNLNNRCQVKLYNVDENSRLYGIPIRSSYTSWDKFMEDGTFSGEDFRYFLQANFCVSKQIRSHIEYYDKKADKLREFFYKLHGDHKFYYPKRQPYALEQQQQGNSQISVEFLRRLNFVKGEWVMDVSDIDFGIDHVAKIEKKINDELKVYHIPVDVAFFCSINNSFTYTSNLFSLLTCEQQRDMVETAKWMHENMYKCTPSQMRERLFTIVESVKRSYMAHVFVPVTFVWSKLSSFMKILMKVAVFAGSIYILKQLGSLLLGSKVEPTSKFMHRVQVQNGMKFRGSYTAGILNDSRTQEQIVQNYLDKNVKYFLYQNGSGVVSTAHGIHTGQFLIINSHVAAGMKGGCLLTYRPTVNCETEWQIEITDKNIYCLEGNDLAIIFSRHLPCAKDISGHFITDQDFEEMPSNLEMWSLTNFQFQQSIEIRDKCEPAKKLKMTTVDGEKSHISKALAAEGITVGGKSGSMLVCPSRKPGHRSIVGIQAWKSVDYYRDTIYYQVVTAEMLKEMKAKVLEQVKRPEIIQTGPVVCEYTSSKAQNLVTSHVNIEGSVPKEAVVGMVAKTQFKPTIIASKMEIDGFKSQRVPAALTAFDSRLNVPMHPMQHSINKHGTGKVGTFDLEILEQASHDMAIWLKNRLDKTSFRTDLSLEECITGIREPGSNPVDCRKSAGLPYVLDKWHGKPKGKKAYVDITETGEALIYDVNFQKNFEKNFSLLERGIIPQHSSYDFPKDELRPIKKALGDPELITPPKTRSVTCMSMDMIFAWRRVTLDLMSSLHRSARGDFPFGPGINPEGPDWTRLFHYLKKQHFCLDFDVSNWDGHMPPELIYAAGDMLCMILGIDYNDPVAKVIFSLLTEVLFGHVQFEDLVYQKCRGLISGFPGTAEINTLVHLLLMYYFYLYLSRLSENEGYGNITDFFTFTSPMFYGDDVIIGINQEIIDWFNGKSISMMYKEHGYPVTSASKSGDIPLFNKIENCTFLKSGFRFISPARVDRLMDLSVCYDLMYWVRAKEHPVDQFRSNLYDSFRMIHGHGKAVYDKIFGQVNRWLREAHQPPFDYRWEDFEREKIRNYYSE